MSDAAGFSHACSRVSHRRYWIERRSSGRPITRLFVPAFLLAGLAALVAPVPAAHADKGDYKLDFVAAAPNTYDHATGGGAFDDRSVGVNKDIVESLEGGDFQCGDIVTFLTQIRREVEPSDLTVETLRMQYSFLMDTTGQSGVAMYPVTNVQINYGAVSGGDGIGGTDAGIVDDGGSNVVSWSQVTTPSGDPDADIFQKGSELILTVTVDDLEQSEHVVLRVDVFLDCDFPFSPTGNLQAQLNFTDVVNSTCPVANCTPAKFPARVPGGEQTVPFKQVGAIVYVLPTADFANLSRSTSRVGAGIAASDATRSPTTAGETGDAVPEAEGAADGSSTATPIAGFRAASSSPSDSLPATGSSSTADVMRIGVLFVSAGLVLLVAVRRRFALS